MNNSLLVQQSFGPNAQKYAQSAVFAKGESLERLIAVTAPQPEWNALDVATGGGHTALALARHVRQVIATDITPQMLDAAQTMIAA
ncbi:MAG TPA: class I SAM-dependent methyltransferase, partial [Anaerolineales bacterium]|nr:class I SAM-dependent methyltransferase [Anaerolineales bacterium]